MPHTFATALHAAYYCPMTGVGLFLAAMPDETSQNVTPWTAALQRADREDMLAQLSAHGIALQGDDEQDGAWAYVDTTPDGREVFALYGAAPITSDPTMEERAEALAELRRAAGLT